MQRRPDFAWPENADGLLELLDEPAHFAVVAWKQAVLAIEPIPEPARDLTIHLGPGTLASMEGSVRARLVLGRRWR